MLGELSGDILPLSFSLSKALRKGGGGEWAWKQLWEDISVGPADAAGVAGQPVGFTHDTRVRPGTHSQGFSDSIMQTAAGSRAKSFQQRYLSSWQTSKFYVLGFWFVFFF